MKEPFYDPFGGDDPAVHVDGPSPVHFDDSEEDIEEKTPTAVLPVVDVADEVSGEEVEYDEVYWFRRHFREPLLRMLLIKDGPRGYRWLYGIGAVLMVACGVSWAMNFDRGWLFFGLIVAGSGIFGYPILREWYRWRKRIVLITHEPRGVRITFREPNKVLLLFNGDGDGNSIVYEGSVEINTSISWPNKLIFWGCGDLQIFGKIEAGELSSLENVPHVKEVQQYLRGEAL